MKCKICLNIKDIASFDFRKDRSSYRTVCKDCRRISQNSRNKNRVQENSLYRKKKYQQNSQQILLHSKSFRENFKKINGVSYNTFKKRTNITFKLKNNLRKRLNSAIKNNQKSGSAVKDLGCSIEELKIYLESKFQPGMSWDNYGSYWEIDHIIPLSGGNLTDPIFIQQVCHYLNLQPLTKADNIKKGARR